MQRASEESSACHSWSPPQWDEIYWLKKKLKKNSQGHCEAETSIIDRRKITQSNQFMIFSSNIGFRENIWAKETSEVRKSGAPLNDDHQVPAMLWEDFLISADSETSPKAKCAWRMRRLISTEAKCFQRIMQRKATLPKSWFSTCLDSPPPWVFHPHFSSRFYSTSLQWGKLNEPVTDLFLHRDRRSQRQS